MSFAFGLFIVLSTAGLGIWMIYQIYTRQADPVLLLVLLAWALVITARRTRR